MAQLGADVVSAAQNPSALPSADMLGLEVVISRSWGSIKRPAFLLLGLPLDCFPLALATMLLTHVSTTIQVRAANTHALRRLFFALVANAGMRGATTAAVDGGVS